MTKVCTLCNTEKQLDDFYVEKLGKYGRRSKCKVCMNRLNKEWRDTHPPPKVDPIKSKEYKRKWLINNRDKRREWEKIYNKQEYVKERRNKYLRETGKGLAQVHKRRALLKAGGEWTPQEWIELCDIYDNKCLRCNKPEVTVDHVIPLDLGGPNTVDNLQPLCRSCNSSKGTQIKDYRRSTCNTQSSVL